MLPGIWPGLLQSAWTQLKIPWLVKTEKIPEKKVLHAVIIQIFICCFYFMLYYSNQWWEMIIRIGLETSKDNKWVVNFTYSKDLLYSLYIVCTSWSTFEIRCSDIKETTNLNLIHGLGTYFLCSYSRNGKFWCCWLWKL